MKAALVILLLVVFFGVQAQDDKKENKPLVVQDQNKPSPLWIIDGVKMSDTPGVTPKTFLDIDPKDIDRISVVKGDSALYHYGEAGRNGVIVLTTKKPKLKKSEDHR